MPKINPRIAMAIGILGLSASAIFVRFAAAPGLVTATWRMIFSAVLLLPFVLRANRRQASPVRAVDVALCAASGVMLALHFVCWFAALKLTSVASATVLVDTDAIFTAIGFAVFFHGRIPRGGVFAIGLAFAGSAVIALSSVGGTGSLRGNLLALAGAVFVSGYILIGRRQRAHLSALLYTFLTYSFSAAALLLMCLFTHTRFWGWPLREVGIGLALAVVCTLGGHSIISWCLKYLSPAYITAAKLAEPVIASVLAAFLFAEIPTTPQLLGGAVVLAGIALYTRAEQSAAMASASMAQPAPQPPSAPQ